MALNGKEGGLGGGFGFALSNSAILSRKKIIEQNVQSKIQLETNYLARCLLVR